MTAQKSKIVTRESLKGWIGALIFLCFLFVIGSFFFSALWLESEWELISCQEEKENEMFNLSSTIKFGNKNYNSWLITFNPKDSYLKVAGEICHQVTCECAKNRTNPVMCMSICYKCEGRK